MSFDGTSSGFSAPTTPSFGQPGREPILAPFPAQDTVQSPWQSLEMSFRPTQPQPMGGRVTSLVYEGQISGNDRRCPLGYGLPVARGSRRSSQLWWLFDQGLTELRDPRIQASGRVPELLAFVGKDSIIRLETSEFVVSDCTVDLLECQQEQRTKRPNENPDVLQGEVIKAITEAGKAFNSLGQHFDETLVRRQAGICSMLIKLLSRYTRRIWHEGMRTACVLPTLLTIILNDNTGLRKWRYAE